MKWPNRRLRLPPLEIEEGDIDASLLDFLMKEVESDRRREERVTVPSDMSESSQPASSHSGGDTRSGQEASDSGGGEGVRGGQEESDSGAGSGGDCGKEGDSGASSSVKGGGEQFSEGGSGGGRGAVGGGGEKNDTTVVDLVAREFWESWSARRAIARVFELIVMELGETEERTRHNTRPSSRYNTKRIMLRPYERRPLSWYRFASRQAIVVIVDTSGSMEWLSGELQLTGRVLLKRGDIEFYEAPNGIIKRKYVRGGRAVRVEHEKVLRSLVGRTIVYIGDFDGSDTPIILSRRNRVVWIAPEFRYADPFEHSWTTVNEPFRGVFIRVKSLSEVLAYIRQIVRSKTAWFDPYRQEIEDEEEVEE